MPPLPERSDGVLRPHNIQCGLLIERPDPITAKPVLYKVMSIAWDRSSFTVMGIFPGGFVLESRAAEEIGTFKPCSDTLFQKYRAGRGSRTQTSVRHEAESETETVEDTKGQIAFSLNTNPKLAAEQQDALEQAYPRWDDSNTPDD